MTQRHVRAAAVIPRLRDGRVLVGARTQHARSWPGTLAFPGGATETTDAELPVLGGGPTDLPMSSTLSTPRSVRACALRELGEEVGLWRLCKTDGTFDDKAKERAIKGLLDGRSLHDVLAHNHLVLDDRCLLPLLMWKTWDGRFAVLQFLLPLDEIPPLSPVIVDELTALRWELPSVLRAQWRNGEQFFIPPIRRVIVELSKLERDLPGVIDALRAEPNASERARVDLVEGIAVLATRTPTLPPATHTNTVLLGAGDALLVDPATPYPDEHDRFDRQLVACLRGHRLQAIVCTHHHNDHVGDVDRVARQWNVPVWAHEATASRVSFKVARILRDGEVLACPGDPPRDFRVVETPGHAPGHICLFEEQTRLLVAGDMVAGTGSILIDPPEGHMATYLASLQRLIDLEPRGLVPSHGPLLAHGKARLEEQLAHRHARTEAVVAALPTERGIDVPAIVSAVYGTDTPPAMFPFAERSVTAILEMCREQQRAVCDENLWRAFANAASGVSSS